MDSLLWAAAQVPWRFLGQVIAGFLTEDLAFLAIATLLTPGQVHGDVVVVVEPAEQAMTCVTLTMLC